MVRATIPRIYRKTVRALLFFISTVALKHLALEKLCKDASKILAAMGTDKLCLPSSDHLKRYTLYMDTTTFVATAI